jgi:hypothetical protein
VGSKMPKNCCLLDLSTWWAEKSQKTATSPFSKEFQNLSKNFKLQNSKIAENHYLDVFTPSTGKRKIAATVDFANPE